VTLTYPREWKAWRGASFWNYPGRIWPLTAPNLSALTGRLAGKLAAQGGEGRHASPGAALAGNPEAGSRAALVRLGMKCALSRPHLRAMHPHFGDCFLTCRRGWRDTGRRFGDGFACNLLPDPVFQHTAGENAKSVITMTRRHKVARLS